MFVKKSKKVITNIRVHRFAAGCGLNLFPSVYILPVVDQLIFSYMYSWRDVAHNMVTQSYKIC